MKKIILAVCLLGLCAVSLNAYSGGDGTSANPYQIANLTDLQTLETDTLSWGACFQQTANIDASATSSWNGGEGWLPVGCSDTTFTGTYDGDGFTISGLYINRNMSIVGFFGYAKNATIANLGLVDCNITNGSSRIGALIGYMRDGSVTNCYTTGTVTGTGSTDYVGGCVGDVAGDASFTNSHSSCNVTAGDDYAGGLIGRIGTGSTTCYKCYATGSVSADDYAGGLIGRSSSTNPINSCYATGSVTTVDDYAAGLVGYGNAINCYATGTVTAGDDYAGGLIGRGAATNCYSTGYATGDINIGGLIGTASGDTEGSFWNTETSGQSTSAAGTGATTAQMTNATITNNIFLNAGWDFKGVGAEVIWNIGNGRNNGYPYLDWEYSSDPGTLPVELSAFTATYNSTNGYTTIEWTTASETDIIGFNIYRNTADHFDTSEKINVEVIEGHGTTTEISTYSFIDDSQLDLGTVYYYWLESVELGGINTVYSSIDITPSEGSGGYVNDFDTNSLSNFPNPVKGSTTISYAIKGMLQSQPVEIDIYNMLGQLIDTVEGTNGTATWNTSDHASGIYFYKLNTDSYTEIKKMMLVK